MLDLVVRSEKAVVVTGAMRGPEAPGADGPANILAATIVAAAREASGLGTLVVLNDEIHAARFVQKSHTALPSAFTSPLAGPLGLVVEGRPRVLIHNGLLMEDVLRAERMTRHELMAALRRAGCDAIDQVHAAVLENDGHISVVPRHVEPPAASSAGVASDVPKV